MESIRLKELDRGEWFRTLLTYRIGTLVDKDRGLEVKWSDGRGSTHVHDHLQVEPWPRETLDAEKREA